MKIKILIGDVLEQLATLPDDSIDCCVTSPPYWGLRDYGVPGQIGLEPSLGEHIKVIVNVFEEIKRVLKPTGTCWLNYGDCYARDSAKGGSGPNGKHDYHSDYGSARNIVSETRGSSDGFVGRADLAARRLGDKALKPKDLCMMPNRIAIALQDAGWWVRSEIIWHKPNPMPESVTDRPTNAHEKIFLLTKSARYFYDAEAVREERLGTTHSRGSKRKPPIEAAGVGHKDWCRYMTADDELTTRNLRNVWTVQPQPFSEAHFATFPPALIEPCIKAGCPKGGTVLDPFGGAGTTGLVADRLGRDAILIELNPEYAEIAKCRLDSDAGMFSGVETTNGEDNRGLTTDGCLPRI